MSEFMIVTIDGPAASGKTSVARELARQLGWEWVSTGAFYRGLAYVAQKEGVSLKDDKALSELAQNSVWEVKLNPEKTQVFYKKKDITGEIYTEGIGTSASEISGHPIVRQSLLEAQRKCVQNHLVAEGRDCGTVVFPRASVKIYLTAQSQSRAERRAKEEGKAVQELALEQSRRDERDSQRKVAPLQIPDRAHVLDTSELNLSQVVDQVTQIVCSELGLYTQSD